MTLRNLLWKLSGPLSLIMWLCVTGHAQGVIAGPMPLLKKGAEPERLVLALACLMFLVSWTTVFLNRSRAICFSAALIVMWILIGFVASNMIDW